MTQIQLFFQALTNLENSIDKILDSFDMTLSFIFKDSDLAESLDNKKSELENLKKELGESNSMVKKLSKEVCKLEAKLFSSNKFKQKNIIKDSSFLYIYSIFENHNNELIKIAEKSRSDIEEKIRDNLRRLIQEKKVLNYHDLEKKIYRGKLKNFSEHILRQPDFFNKLVHLFGYKDTFSKKSEKNNSRLLSILDLHSEIKIRRNILTHNSKSSQSFEKYINQIEGKHGIKNPEKRKKVIEKIYGVSGFDKLEDLQKNLRPNPQYLSLTVGVLIEIMITFFYNSFLYTVNLNDFTDEEKNGDKFQYRETSLFGNIINRINCSYKTLRVFNYDNIQRLIYILLINGSSLDGKLKIYDKNIYNNHKIPWMDYINRVLHLIVMKDDCNRAVKMFDEVISKDKNNSKKQNYEKAKNEGLKVLELFEKEIEINLKLINDSDANLDAKGMINCFSKNDTYGFIRHYESYNKKEFESNKDRYDSFEDYMIDINEEYKHSWFMVKYLIDNNNKDFIKYIKT